MLKAFENKRFSNYTPTTRPSLSMQEHAPFMLIQLDLLFLSRNIVLFSLSLTRSLYADTFKSCSRVVFLGSPSVRSVFLHVR